MIQRHRIRSDIGKKHTNEFKDTDIQQGEENVEWRATNVLMRQDNQPECPSNNDLKHIRQKPTVNSTFLFEYEDLNCSREYDNDLQAEDRLIF